MKSRDSYFQGKADSSLRLLHTIVVAWKRFLDTPVSSFNLLLKPSTSVIQVLFIYVA